MTATSIPLDRWCPVSPDELTSLMRGAKRIGAAAVVVLGHPNFYPKFSFVSASRFGIRSEYDVPDEVFMIQELREGALEGKSGTVEYHEAFQGL